MNAVHHTITFVGAGPGAADLITLRGVNALAQAQVVYGEGYMWDLDCTKQALRKAFTAAKASGAKVAFTLSDVFCVERSREEIGMACPVVATGGDALNLRAHLPFLQAVEPDLTLYGLRQIYGINFKCPLPPRHGEN